MKIKLFGELIDEQLEFLLPKTLIADLIIFIATLPFYGVGCEIPLGLLLGTAAMLANIVLLGHSVGHAVERPTARAARRYMFSFYLIRFAIMGAALAVGFLSPLCNSVCTFLPLLFPKVFYTGSAIFKRKS